MWHARAAKIRDVAIARDDAILGRFTAELGRDL
jgi:hypothetical protein